MSSSPATPDVQTSALPAPQPTNPVADRTVADASPEFRWTTIPGANQFRVQLGAAENFETVYHDTVVDGPSPLPLADVLPETVDRVFWRVRIADREDAAWSTAASFFVSEQESNSGGTFLVDAPPVPVRPLDGEPVAPEAVTLSWEQVPEAGGYRVQVGDTRSLEAPSVDLTVDRTTHLTLYDTLPEGQEELYWRVRPLFSGETEGRWSATVHFQTEMERDEGREPTDDLETNPEDEEISRTDSPRVAGPARTSTTSGTMAWTFIAVLCISFVLTILLIAWSI